MISVNLQIASCVYFFLSFMVFVWLCWKTSICHLKLKLWEIFFWSAFWFIMLAYLLALFVYDNDGDWDDDLEDY